MSDLKTAVDRVIAAGNELRELYGHDERAVPRAPADPKALPSFAKRFKGKVPPSFVELLGIYDGIDKFDWVDLTLHGSAFLTEHPDLDETWVEAEKAKRGELFVVGWADTDSSCIAFERTTVGRDGEMPVLNFDSKGPVWRAKNLRAYLAMRAAWFRKHAAKKRADRTPRRARRS
jgi:hypothetical protein